MKPLWSIVPVGRSRSIQTPSDRADAGAVVRRRLENALRKLGFDPPTLCTREELLADTPDAGGRDV